MRYMQISISTNTRKQLPVVLDVMMVKALLASCARMWKSEQVQGRFGAGAAMRYVYVSVLMNTRQWLPDLDAMMVKVRMWKSKQMQGGFGASDCDGYVEETLSEIPRGKCDLCVTST